MLNKGQHISNTAMLGSCGTSALDTGIRHSFASNSLRFYSPTTGKRRRKASSTAQLRGTVCALLQKRHPDIRRIKITDTGLFFSARVRLCSGRIVHRQAYSLPNLFGLLDDSIPACLS